ncbi:MAG TPA: tetratricopeptide repeat protein [Bryobacteraceae bacterium]|nr:tetratricopeptide repeat protein [Bryobacteraceae bacterium]
MSGPAPRVFLSHSSKDQEFVSELYRRLTDDGVPCFFSPESIGWGDNWVKALERALDECEYVVFLLSPDFCNSRWVEVERTSSIADDPAGLKRKVRPLTLQPCDHLPTFPRFLRHIQTIDISTAAAFERNYPRICRGLGGTPREDTPLTDRTKLPPPHPLPERHRMPYRSLGDKFIGRVDPFWDLRDSLFRHGTSILAGEVVVVGTGGLGKTQLAVEYAHRFGSAYPGGVYWVDGDRGLSTLIAQVGEAAGLAVDPKAPETDQLEQLWHGLNRLPGPSLVILDNFPERKPLQPYLPVGGRVHALVTTRRQDLDYPSVRLNILTTEEGILLLNSGRRLFGDEAGALVARLGGLPLALELAKAYLNYHSQLTIPALLEEMSATRDKDIPLLAEFASEYHDHLPTRHETDIVRTFQLSWEAAPELAKKVLRAMGELAPVAVPRTLLRPILELPADAGVRDPLGNALDELVRLSLVELDTNGNPIAHRLILAFARHRNAADSASPFDRCLAVVLQQMGRASLTPDGRTIAELNLVAPHAESLLTDGRVTPQDLSRLAGRLGTHYQALGRYSDAKRLLTAALDSAEKTFASGHPSIAAAQSNLAALLWNLGQLQEARDLLQKALASYERTFEAGHASIATMQSILALVLRDLGQLAEARDLLQKALASNERSFEPGHPSIAIRQSNLASVLQDLGRLEKARDLLQKALASAEKTFEPGHPSIARRQSNLAILLRNLGQLEEARDLLQKALASAEKTFEPGHPSIAIVQSNLALALQDLGQLEEACDLLQKALASDEKTFEPGHPAIAIGQSNLAMVLQDLGQLEEARDLLGKALASAEKTFEPGHPSIATRQSNLATVLQGLGQLEEACDLLRKALASDQKTFEPGHPTIAVDQSNLAMVLKDLGQLEEARDLLQKAHQTYLNRFGPDHPNTRKIQRNLESLGG